MAKNSEPYPVTTTFMRDLYILQNGDPTDFDLWLADVQEKARRQGYRQGCDETDYDNVQSENFGY